jgi:hypothetical protein
MLSINVYRTDYDCTNNGPSSRHYRMYVLKEDEALPDTVDPDKVLRVVKRKLFGSLYVHLEPVKPVTGQNIGGMSGGNIAYSCDSRWVEHTGVHFPVQIHDRVETVEQYNANFD